MEKQRKGCKCIYDFSLAVVGWEKARLAVRNGNWDEATYWLNESGERSIRFYECIKEEVKDEDYRKYIDKIIESYKWAIEEMKKVFEEKNVEKAEDWINGTIFNLEDNAFDFCRCILDDGSVARSCKRKVINI